MSYKFFYFRATERNNAKIGTTSNPWERLRVQQQGTDEKIKFDGLWLVHAPYGYILSKIEKNINQHFWSQCLFRDTNAAGHTEWYKNISMQEYKEHLYLNTNVNNLKILELGEYSATRTSDCPFNLAPGGADDWEYGRIMKNFTITNLLHNSSTIKTLEKEPPNELSPF